MTGRPVRKGIAAIMLRLLMGVGLVLLGWGSALAADKALVVTLAGPKPGAAQRVLQGSHRQLATLYRQAGYETVAVFGVNKSGIQQAVRRFEAGLGDADRIIVHVVGPTISVGRESWLQPSGASVGTRTDLQMTGIPFSLFLNLAATRPGQNLVVLGTPSAPAKAAAAYANASHVYDVPHGVTVMQGVAPNVQTVMQRDIIGQGLAVREIPDDENGVRFDGDVSNGLVLSAIPDPAPQEPELQPVNPVEEALWALAKESGEADILQAYLDRYPDGRHVAEATAMLREAVRPASPEDIEGALNLTRDQRRRVQQNLTTLGFDTRGVDGIFGRGTRDAVRRWQIAERYDPTGYLDRDQLDDLESLASAREAELKAEEERQQRQERIADRAYWRQTGQSGERVDLGRYLDRYPEGLFADRAREELAVYREAEVEEAWDATRQIDTADGYAAFLRDYDDSVYADEARARLNALQGVLQGDALRRAQAEERAVGLNVASILLMEQRLRNLGYAPGRIDGRIDENTRKAIAAFQRAQELRVTGYVDQDTIRRLIVTPNR